MAVKIRLTRMGKKKAPHYRIVVADSHVQRDGGWIDELGFYNPMTEPSQIKLDMEKAKYWLSKGAQPTDTVRILIKKQEAKEA